MTAEREIAAMPAAFAAGTATGILCMQSASSNAASISLYMIPMITMITVMACISVCMVRIRRGTIPGQAVLSSIYFLIGMLGAETSILASIGSDTSVGPVKQVAESFALGMKDCIARLSFKSPDTYGLVTALITGDKIGLSRQSISAFRESGASHILALSGMHLGIIYMMLSIIFGLLGKSPVGKCARSLCIIFCSLFYCIATGASASIVRAFIFIALYEAARMSGRSVRPARVLGLSLLIQLSLSPTSIGEVGFQLSYFAMGGIIYLFPALKRWYPGAGFSISRKIWDITAMSISCQVFTAPAVWIYFGTFPVYFMITNMISLPLVSILIPLAVTCTGLEAAGICPDFLVRITEWTATALLYSMETIASL